MKSRVIWFPAIGAVVLCAGWYWPSAQPLATAPATAALASAVLVDDDDEDAIASHERPAAMADVGRYAATRLREIKADATPWNDVWMWRREFTLANTPELRREVVGLARQVGPDSFLAVLAQALASDDPALRVEAARSIATLPDNRMAEGIQLGVAAPDAETRREVMDIIEQVQPHLRAELLRASLLAGPSDVQQRAVELLSDQPNPKYFAVLIESLRVTAGEERQAVEQAIASVVGETLTDYEVASRWWAENHAHFDGMMARVE
jgi:hypothetical protein